ncbi:phosphoenolpyruvate--protein phosphotransferase [Shewanella sp. 4t3-1-2LB]|uniref:phosphoenolpyruvate--protein phosphotransferase n=1 Tax=Shewanella sp. 4t3-1-2LB TaxID=2817682 RepID=UPI001A990C37|nr:phosphoenolpyruvate--protein phosphotransferase [Shewanella sp. 4t3-1-2LB]MBO1272652.1 phosphoenolpyruvate--protein phosphotransferase [Shewanella sp. 4t3-1-2LB]
MEMKGIAVSSGIAQGKAVLFEPFDNSLDYRLLPLSSIPSEQAKASHAVAQLCQQLRNSLLSLEAGSANYQLVEADLLLLDDAELTSQISRSINTLQLSAGAAVQRVFYHQASEMEALDDPYLARRAQDVLSLSKRLIATINGAGGERLQQLQEDSILLAEDLTPAEFALLPLNHIKGIVLKTGGITSHTAILARAAGIPALLSCNFDAAAISNGTELFLDGYQGKLYAQPDAKELATLQKQLADDRQRRDALARYRDIPCVTQDGHSLTLLANVGNLNDIARLPQSGAEGIGLFRTEFMLMDAVSMPDEKEQFSLYCEALQLIKGKCLTIRTLDVGADKEFSCINQLLAEDNPALGVRGLRYTLRHKDVLHTQLRAVLRAAAFGQVRLMFPMVCQPEELDELFAEIEICRQQLLLEQKPFAEPEYGIVVETPAAVVNLSTMLPRLSFVSIGTNDLAQYTLAADRGNPQLTASYPAFCPAVLQLIAQTLNTAKAAGVTTSLCGELASDPRIAPLLMGMGFDELSANAAALPEIKAAICEGKFSEFVELAQKALQCQRISELESLLSGCQI